MRDAFTDQLDAVHADLARICEAVRTAVERATHALFTGNAAVAEQVISDDAEIDRAREQLEEHAFELLSRQAPVAGDLRTVVASLRMVGELERMGDLSVHVAKIARMRVPQVAVPDDLVPMIGRMAQLAEEMVQQAGEIIRDRDAARAADLVPDEEELDRLRSELFRTLLAEDWQHGVETAVDIALLCRYYERIGDHALSLATRIVFVVTGQPSRED
ncbi:phosphate signaling complex protein PhoU [Nocardioides yefusunii]|uniref:Phosphate-specific transport system accessory protein PhoU n=1 Tax=Nocardioides yefusunii TaxID=2500546 RepID=A0ABW1QY57_9ACTN|nr:phosphate signaling complex protein PhoU [Nocardioides yefusunii]